MKTTDEILTEIERRIARYEEIFSGQSMGHLAMDANLYGWYRRNLLCELRTWILTETENKK